MNQFASSQSSYAGRMANLFAPVVTATTLPIKRREKIQVQKQECQKTLCHGRTVMENSKVLSLHAGRYVYRHGSQKDIVLSACESLGSSKTAWFILHRLSLIMDLMMAQANGRRCC